MSFDKLDPKALDRVDRKVLDDVVRVGWSDISVFPTEDSPGLPFNYTVGLCELGHPELLIMGMSNHQMHGVLSAAVSEVQDGRGFQPHTYSTKVLQGLHVAFLEVLDLREDRFPLSMALRLFGEDIKALQVVWPDAKDRFPWHDDFDPDLEGRQVLVGPWLGSMDVT